MDILQRIIDLREERNWTEYTLAQRSGLSQSTISTWYRKKLTPTVPSIEKICAACGITLSQFFLEEDDCLVRLTKKQLRMLSCTSRLTPEQYTAIIRLLNSFQSSQH